MHPHHRKPECQIITRIMGQMSLKTVGDAMSTHDDLSYTDHLRKPHVLLVCVHVIVIFFDGRIIFYRVISINISLIVHRFIRNTCHDIALIGIPI